MDVKTGARTLDFFEVFARQQRPMRLSELALLTGTPVSSCFQLVRTLERRGYMYGLNGKTYYPTKRMLRNAELIAAHDPAMALLGPPLERLRDETGESVTLAQQVEGQAMILEVFESPHNVRYTAKPGELRQLHCSSVGKALLSAMTRQERDRCLPPEPFCALTEFTITSRDELEQNLQEAQSRGWCVSLSESVPELHALSAPLRFAGRVFAISVAGPITRFEPRHEAHGHALLRTIKAIETAHADPSPHRPKA